MTSLTPTRLAPSAGSKLLLIGGCGGIGRNLVFNALSNDLEVTVMDLPVSIEKHPMPPEVLTIAVDVTLSQQVSNAFSLLTKKWDQLQGLVNLAGFLTTFEPVEKFNEKDWDVILEGNLKSTFLCCKSAISLMKNGGSIVNMSTGLAFIGRPGYGPYSAAKAGIVSLTKTIAIENAPHIRCNAVAPGAVNTAFLSGGTAHGGEEGSVAKRIDLEAFKKMVPLGRIAEPEDITAPILFLLGDASRYITGQVLHINGGSLMV